jgi:hypothetical protein
MRADGLVWPRPLARPTKWPDQDVDQPHRGHDFNESFDRIEQLHHIVRRAKSLPMKKSHVSRDIPLEAIQQERIYYKENLYFFLLGTSWAYAVSRLGRTNWEGRPPGGRLRAGGQLSRGRLVSCPAKKPIFTDPQRFLTPRLPELSGWRTLQLQKKLKDHGRVHSSLVTCDRTTTGLSPRFSKTSIHANL